jgi:hypothetical protein
MSTKGIRIEATNKLYQELLEVQRNYRIKDGKKVALSFIIIDYCQKWMNHSKNSQNNYQNVNGLLQQQEHKALNQPHQKSPIPSVDEIDLLARKNELDEREDRLRQWENDLREQAFTLINKDQTVSEKTEDALRYKEEALDLKEQAQEKNIQIEIQKTVNASISMEITEKNEQIDRLENEIRYMREDVIKMLRRIDRQTEKSVFMDYVVPFLPIVATIIMGVILNKSISGNTEMNQFEKEIFDLYNGMKPDLQNGFREYVQNLAKNYTKNNTSNGKDSETKK